jgi:isoleucyl-tRNA synthetase
MSAGPDERPYPDVPAQPNFAEIELAVLASWAAERTFERSVERRPAGDNDFVFYDGPPFANGLPHYGHLLTGYVKDAIPRYQTMRGHRVERRFGWDCHGLPAEMETEKELGITGHVAITAYGIDRFNEACRTSVLRYTREWQTYVTRQARWVDFAHDYKTLDLSYMESVMWAFRQLWDRDLIYEGYKVLPYCWECETPLSNFETRLDDAYRDRQDPALTVRFRLETGDDILVWTTTPWTLPSNLALAVGPDIDYARLEERDGHRVLIGTARLPAYERELGDLRRIGTVRGSELVGRRYTPLFPFFAGTANAFQVLGADFVDTEEGTGTVHLAPGFGEDDQLVCEAHGIAVVVPIDEHARFTAAVPDYEGQQVFEANANVIRDLKAAGVVIRHETYDHSYPHCWRTDTPLVYRAISSWFVKVTDIKDRAGELNQDINWVPEHVRDGAFGTWLHNARDWSISRNRFWGSPIPVWRSDDARYPRTDVYGSLDELERDFGVRPTDLHRPGIDELTRPNPDDPTGQSMMRRVEQVLDCWFESGSMPYAQVHYPFENKEWFEGAPDGGHFPADFIVEYIGQTRAWFYNLHVLSTALFDSAPFRNCVVHGVLLGDDGRKASKRLRNYVDPEEMFDTFGADAVRWFLLSSAVLRGQDLVFARRGVADAVRAVLNPIWNTWYFFTLYANADRYRARIRTEATGVLDRYVLAKAHDLVNAVTGRMDAYDLSGACNAIAAFLDALTNWYVRRSRDRFWDGDPDAFDTLSTVLDVLCRVGAPLLPMVSEHVWRGLTGGDSVHLTDWPLASELPADPELVQTMDRVRDVCSAASSVRKAQGLPVRLPLARLTVTSPDAEALRPFIRLIADELNVKEVTLSTDAAGAGRQVLKLVPAVLGPRVGGDVQELIRAVKSGDWSRSADGTVVVGNRTLGADEYELRLVSADESVSRTLPGDAGLIVLDIASSPEFVAEGIARGVIRLVQRARKHAGLDVSDRIHLRLGVNTDLRDAIEVHQDRVTEQTLALSLAFEANPTADYQEMNELDGEPVIIAFSRSG